MKYRKLRDIEVSAVGMGCMGFSHGYGAIPTEEESIRLMHKAYDLGCTLFDTAEAYGPYVNEELVGKGGGYVWLWTTYGRFDSSV